MSRHDIAFWIGQLALFVAGYCFGRAHGMWRDEQDETIED
jgi:hypothetical protein